jgi:hypothetical protein
MKRGRPSSRHEVQTLILDVLETTKTYMTVSGICDQILMTTKKRISWNTVQKYVRELVELDKVQSVTLPHSKKEGREGLTVYILKK